VELSHPSGKNKDAARVGHPPHSFKTGQRYGLPTAASRVYLQCGQISSRSRFDGNGCGDLPQFPGSGSGLHGLATARRIQSSQGMAETKATNGAKSAEERKQAREPEMELIREAQAGSRTAFDTLVRQYEQQVLRLALHLTGSEHDAEDIYQEAFLKAYRYLGNFRFECSFYTWIYRIVTNLCLDQLRRRKNEARGPSGGSGPLRRRDRCAGFGVG